MFDDINHEYLQHPLHFGAFLLAETEFFKGISIEEPLLQNNHQNQYARLFPIFFLSLC
jgi:hypothetical protein